MLTSQIGVGPARMQPLLLRVYRKHLPLTLKEAPCAVNALHVPQQLQGLPQAHWQKVSSIPAFGERHLQDSWGTPF